MTNEEMCLDALSLCKKTRCFIPSNEILDIAISALEENTKLKAENERLKIEKDSAVALHKDCSSELNMRMKEVEQLKTDLERSVRLPKTLDKGTVCYTYANSVYTVSVENIGKVFKLRGIRNFYESYEEAKQSLKGVL